MTLRGRLEHRDVESGTWVLHTASGGYVLLGSVAKALDGATVEVEGDEVESFGFAMAGPQIQVRTVRRAD